MVSVCLSDKCSKKALACGTCEKELHVGHDIIPLKRFLSYADELRYSNPAIKALGEFSKQAKDCRVKCLAIINETREGTLQQLAELEAKVEATYAAAEVFATSEAQQSHLQPQPPIFNSQLSIIANNRKIHSYCRERKMRKDLISA